MRNRLFQFLALALLLLPGRLAVLADEAQAAKTVRLLTVGNSFSHNAVHYLGELAKASGDTLVLHEANIGGATMQQHWEKAQQYERDPSDKLGRYATGRSLKEELIGEKWDFVTIQQYSMKSHDVATYRPFAGQLRDYIKQYAPEAEVLIHETWEYRRDDPRFSGQPAAPGEPATQQAMYDGLASAYATIARELGVRRIPVGDAFHMADSDPKWGYQPDAKFDLKSAQPPALPDQTHSLHQGRQWTKGKDGKETLTMDGHHANTAGEYLGACVFYEVLFGKSVLESSFVPAGLQPDYARFLRETAHRAVAGQVERK
jgi:hypothetical protein